MQPRQSLFALFALWLLAGALPSALAQNLPTVRPERVGISSDRLERIDAHMQQAVEDGVMIGGLGLIARRGRVAYMETYGLADREAERPMSADSIFRIYSMTKPVTGVAVMLLHEEGRFLLHDPIGKHLPELADLRVATVTADAEGDGAADGPSAQEEDADAAPQPLQTRQPRRQPNIRDLLRHTAGFTYGIFGETPVDALYREAELITGDMTTGDFITRLGEIPLQYEPGARWHYSVSVDVQGALVEAVSGMSLGQFMQERIFGPLGMVDTSFTAPNEKWARVAQLYSPEGLPGDWSAFMAEDAGEGLVIADDQFNRDFREGAKFQSGGGGLLSTATDYLRFCQMLLNGGELDDVRLLSPKSVALMASDHLADVEIGFAGKGIGFGLGFAVVLDPGTLGQLGTAGTYSWGGAAGTTFWIDPQEELIGIFMTQSIPHRTQLGDQFRTLAYQSLVD